MFILSSNHKLEPELSTFDRLYAYPNIPIITKEHMIILDSGAFALSKKKKKMDDDYLKKLAQHYGWYAKHDNVYFVAPDVFKFPELSMKQFLSFKQICDIDVAPVIQFKNNSVDLFCAKKQIKFYRQYCNPRMVCISNHNFGINKERNNIKFVVEMIKECFGDIKIHVLGAGFNSADVAKWASTGITSMDSISYYTDAPRQKWIFGRGDVEPSDRPFKEVALHNAHVAVESAKNWRAFV